MASSAFSRTKGATDLKCGCFESFRSWNTTASEVDNTAPAPANLFKATDRSNGRCDDTASHAMWTLRPFSSISSVVCRIQTCVSSPHNTQLLIPIDDRCDMTSGVAIENIVFSNVLFLSFCWIKEDSSGTVCLKAFGYCSVQTTGRSNAFATFTK